MILSKYPLVVQKDILDHMNIIDLLLLSFVSKNMKKLVTLFQKKRSESIRSIEYEYDRTDESCLVYIPKESEPKSSKPSPETVECMLMRIVKRDIYHKDATSKTLEFRFGGEYEYPVVSYLECVKESVIQSIHNHFLDVFGNSVEYYWEGVGWQWPEECFIPFLPKLKNVTFCTGLFVDGHFAEVSNLENFFSSSPVTKIYQLHLLNNVKPLTPESKFYQAEAIHVNAPLHNCPDFLRHFQGKQFGLSCDSYEKSNLINFANRWKSGEAFQNLEYASVRITNDNDNQYLNSILNEIGAKFIDANRPLPKHTLRQRYDKNTTTHPIISRAYIVRESDSRVASVRVSMITFLFGVWDKTEEEFLKMVE
ncbi:unnamed protein product [Caenorhabditis nigoni]|nr:hypothetical protein B9Z55_000672 [Caenorhabditis nigoni]